MRSSTQRWLIIGTILIVLGAVLFAGAMSLSHWDFNRFGTTRYTSDSVMIGETFRDISIDLDTEEISFVPSSNGTCRVDFNGPEKVKYDASVKSGVLTITSEDHSTWKDHLFSVNAGRTEATVYLPASDYGKLVVRCDTGDVIIPDAFQFEGIDITGDTGDVSCSASVSGPLGIHTHTGHVTLGIASAGEIEIATTTGDVVISTVKCEGSLSVSVDTGEVRIWDTTCRKLSTDGDTGELIMKNVTAEEDFSIKRTTGDVTFELCDAAEIVCRTDTGDVSGTLLTDKLFLTETDTGRVDVPSSTSGGKCEITTDTGDISFSVK